MSRCFFERAFFPSQLGVRLANLIPNASWVDVTTANVRYKLHPCCLPFATFLRTDARVWYPCCLLRTAFGTHPTCYLHSFYAVQHGVRYPRALVRYPCCLLRTPFGTHPACYLHRFCTHRKMPFGTQGPRSAPKGSKLRDPYRKSRFPLWPVNNLTAKASGRG